MFAASVVCAETDALAEELASSADLTLLRFQQGKFSGKLPSIAEAKAHPYTAYEREIVAANRARLFVGSAATVREQLSALAVQTGVGEIMITTMTHAHEARRRSYELLAEAFALSLA
jgi:alkanesulfonate monooxygenase SsuD/methylene tetrahydromethanopterin reductase-like flavin-dependent oxidoreductase (luciferase family)